MNKQQTNILLQSLLVGVISFFVFLYLGRVLYGAFYSPVTTTFDTKKSGGVIKINEESNRTTNATGLAVGTMGGLLGMFVYYSYMTQKKRREHFEKGSGWAEY